MKINGQNYRTIWMEGNSVFLIEQNLLPFKFEIFEAKCYEETCKAIKEMLVRGAGAIGTAAGFALAQAFLQAPENNFWEFVESAKIEIEATRPTAQNLFYATNRVFDAAKKSTHPTPATAGAPLLRQAQYSVSIGAHTPLRQTPEYPSQEGTHAPLRQTPEYPSQEGTHPPPANAGVPLSRGELKRLPEIAVETAQAIADKDAEDSRKIGEFGNELIEDGMRILTHCNAGWLAFTDFGTALSPIYLAHRAGKNIFVYADETRPRSQGARLTAWELKNEGVPHLIIPDNAAAHLMQQGKIDLVIVGADRIAVNGDVANKIGTLEKAICAHEFGIPFYVAAPSSTFDAICPTGTEIPIEERSQEEVLYQTGPDEEGEMQNPGLFTRLGSLQSCLRCDSGKIYF
ncbi:MAG TPA: s-methyl-5-thioribose-1-phosphate isomerase, partial [Candidatus Cloacimonadota bacterium]|nr:s-methyl-5-thioribose-1-phosphate isomerase [Candidatus Cloacimonadota bacterium]